MESMISKTLSERTTRIVIILVLSLLIILPEFSTETYLTVLTTHEQGLTILAKVYDKGNWTAYQTGYNAYVEIHSQLDFPLIYLQAPNASSPVYTTDLTTW